LYRLETQKRIVVPSEDPLRPSDGRSTRHSVKGLADTMERHNARELYVVRVNRVQVQIELVISNWTVDDVQVLAEQ
jgi:hypothetical protein